MGERKIPTKYERFGHGKLMDNVDQWVWEQSLDGCCETAGDCSTIGRHWSKVEFTASEMRRLEGLTDEHGKAVFNEVVIGAIVSEDDQGFVVVDYYSSFKDLDEEWAEIEKDVSDQEEINSQEIGGPSDSDKET